MKNTVAAHPYPSKMTELPQYPQRPVLQQILLIPLQPVGRLRRPVHKRVVSIRFLRVLSTPPLRRRLRRGVAVR